MCDLFWTPPQLKMTLTALTVEFLAAGIVFRVRCETLFLVVEQPFLPPQAAAVTTERSIRSNDAMARDNDADHVLAIGAPNRAAHLDVAEFLRHPRIRARFARRN